MTVERSCSSKQSAYPPSGDGSEFTFKPLIPKLNLRRDSNCAGKQIKASDVTLGTANGPIICQPRQPIADHHRHGYQILRHQKLDIQDIKVTGNKNEIFTYSTPGFTPHCGNGKPVRVRNSYR
ncbi:hypothetical protein J6590_017049 [Homalodisca vitripennis]|nr:hypothetical protein J6590_017049 [Homalodisca vitripennis]